MHKTRLTPAYLLALAPCCFANAQQAFVSTNTQYLDAFNDLTITHITRLPGSDITLLLSVFPITRTITLEGQPDSTGVVPILRGDSNVIHRRVLEAINADIEPFAILNSEIFYDATNDGGGAVFISQVNLLNSVDYVHFEVCLAESPTC